MTWFSRLPDNLKGIVVLLIASILFSVMALIIKVLGQHLHVTQILLLRQFGMGLIILPAIMRYFPASLRSERPKVQLLRLCLALVAILGSFTAVIYLPLADATAIFFAKSFFTTLFAIWFLHERVGIYRWTAVVLGFVGVFIMLQPGTRDFSIYSLFAVMGAAGAAGVMITLRILSRCDNASTILAWSSIGICVALLVPGIYFWQEPTLKEWVLLVLLALVSYGAQRLNIFAYKHGEASLLASLDYTRLLWATLLGFIVFDQLPGVPVWVGASLVVGAALFTLYRESRLKSREDVAI